MLVLKRRQRAYIASAVRELANIAAGAMVFGQLLAAGRFSIVLAAGGVAIWAVLVGFGVVLMKREAL